MAGRLTGKVCVITGAGGGIGREGAIVFTGEGAKVCVADLDLGIAEETVSLCPGEAFATRVNVASFVALLGAATSQISYTASKGAVPSMSRELAVQFARQAAEDRGYGDLPRERRVLVRERRDLHRRRRAYRCLHDSRVTR